PTNTGDVTTSRSGWIIRVREWISRTSFLYRWALANLSLRSRSLAAPEIFAARMTAIQNIPGFEHAFDGWQYPHDLDSDTMCDATTLPAVFQEAVELTGFVLDEYLRHARDDGFSIAVLAADGIRRKHEDFEQFGRLLNGENYYRRLATLLESRGVPLIDLHDYILRQRGRLEDAHFRRDGHWSEQGHGWAAGAVLEFFSAHPDLCQPRSRPR